MLQYLTYLSIPIDSKHLSSCICTYFVFYALYYVITNCDYVSEDF